MRGKVGKVIRKREVKPDQVYNSVVVARLINKVMMDGKKTIAARIVYKALEELGKQAKDEPVTALDKALQNVKPSMEVRSRRVGGANYQIPMPVAPGRQEALAMRWIIDTARGKQGSAFEDLFTKELINAYKGEGDAIKKKSDVEKMAEANKAFAHFRW